MGEQSVVGTLDGWQPGALFAFGAAIVGIVLGSIAGTVWGGYEGLFGFAVGAGL